LAILPGLKVKRLNMKNLITLFLLIPFITFGQQYQAVNRQITPAYEKLKQADLVVPVANFGAKVNPADNVMVFVKQQFDVLQITNSDLILTSHKTSALGHHYVFQQTYKGIPVYKATCNISFNHIGVVLSSFNTLVSTDGWVSEPFNVDKILGKPLWIVSDKSPIAAYQKNNGTAVVITDATGAALAQKEGSFNYAVEDTMVVGKVFLPDPLTSQGVIYGKDDTYQHFNDSDYALLNDQRQEVQFPVTLDNGVFILENQYAKLMNLQAPNTMPVTSTTPMFDHLRSQSGFKDVMVMYHIYATQKYYQSLGFEELKNYQIKVDAHSTSSDNSSFNYSSDSSLNFGTGGVPDAEDGDVSSHEYTHALSWFLNPGPNMNNERRAMEEGICDVIAANMSRQYTDFNWRLLYNFDAPNPITPGLLKFWGGRSANSPKSYQNYTGSPYSDAEIWSSTILDIGEQIGYDKAAKLMLNTIYSMPENCTMPQAAILYMQADSILFNKEDAWKIGPVFNARKLGDFPTGIAEQTKILRQLVIKNSEGFTSGTSVASIDVLFRSMYTITDIQGKVIAQKHSEGTIQLNPQDFVQGMYIITIQGEGGRASLKFIR
jgi:hypothetical protein